MSKGWVTTARGESLNLDQLITDAKRPPGLKDENTEIKKRKIAKPRQLNVRRFKPGAGTAKVPEVPDEMKEQLEARTRKVSQQPRKVAYREGGVAETYADLTGVKLKKTEQAIARRKARMAKEQDKQPDEQQAAPDDNDALNEIMEELGAHDEGVEPEVKKPAPRRRSRKKAT